MLRLLVWLKHKIPPASIGLRLRIWIISTAQITLVSRDIVVRLCSKHRMQAKIKRQLALRRGDLAVKCRYLPALATTGIEYRHGEPFRLIILVPHCECRMQ